MKWVALIVIPMVIFTLDSASRIGLTSGGRGLIEMIRTDIGAWLAWLVFLPMALELVLSARMTFPGTLDRYRTISEIVGGSLPFSTRTSSAVSKSMLEWSW